MAKRKKEAATPGKGGAPARTRKKDGHPLRAKNTAGFDEGREFSLPTAPGNPFREAIRAKLKGIGAHKLQVEANLRRAEMEDLARRKRLREIYGASPVPYDDAWQEAARQYGRRLTFPDLTFVRARLRVLKSGDARDFGPHFDALAALLTVQHENLHTGGEEGYDW